MIALHLLGGLVLLLIGGEALVRGAVALGRRFHLSPLFVGMVIVGFGTSMPELVVGLNATAHGAPGLAAGNVFGSNIANVLLILAAASLVRPIASPPSVLAPDGYVLLGVSFAVVLVTLQGQIAFWQGLIMVMLLIGLIGADYLRVSAKRALRPMKEAPLPKGADVPQRLPVSFLLIASGFATLLYGADLLVEGAIETARAFAVPEDVIGLTIVAIGTSLPELGTALAAAWRGHTDIAYGNVIGSNLFNLLGILGAAAMAGPLTISTSLSLIDGPVMLVATALTLYFVSSGAKLVRGEGIVMLMAYALYLGLRTAYALA